MAITPNSDLYLIKCPLELDNRNQITFTNETNQSNYFKNLPHLLVEDITYQRKDSIIRYPAHIDSIIGYNYCMYKNNNYIDKWFYAYITGMRYINDNMTEISIKTDVFQTWQLELTYKQSFIEREHVNDDTVGLHTVPENLEIGEYTSNGYEREEELIDLSYIIQSSVTITGADMYATNYGGVWGAGGAYIVPDNSSAGSSITNIIQALAGVKADAVINVYMVPSKIINDSTPTDMRYSGQDAPVVWNKTINKQITLDGYSPVNKKLLTYPYQYLILDNNSGVSNILYYEMFSTNNCQFELSGVPTVGGSIKCTPLNYKGSDKFEQEGIMAGKYPVCSWINDTYTNWLTQNSVNVGVGLAASSLEVVGGLGMIATGAGAVAGSSMLLSGSLGVANSLGQVYQHKHIANSAQGNINGGDINTCYDKNTFYFTKMSIKNEYAKILDKYFSMYGYKVNTVKTPNVRGRSNWNFVKTIGANIEGDIPQEDLQEIKNLFDSGITLWHTANNFLDYSKTNSII